MGFNSGFKGLNGGIGCMLFQMRLERIDGQWRGYEKKPAWYI